jgi:hypothetical protein
MRASTSCGWETIATWLDGGGAHAGGELALGLGRDGLIAVGDQEPRRQ